MIIARSPEIWANFSQRTEPVETSRHNFSHPAENSPLAQDDKNHTNRRRECSESLGLGVR